MPALNSGRNNQRIRNEQKSIRNETYISQLRTRACHKLCSNYRSTFATDNTNRSLAASFVSTCYIHNQESLLKTIFIVRQRLSLKVVHCQNYYPRYSFRQESEEESCLAAINQSILFYSTQSGIQLRSSNESVVLDSMFSDFAVLRIGFFQLCVCDNNSF